MRGIRWQYDHIAMRVYDSLYDDDFVRLRLVDPEAGRIDDLVLVRTGRVDCYQFKSRQRLGYFSFIDLTRRRGQDRQSLIRDLGDAWKNIRHGEDALYVHLVTEEFPSKSDCVVPEGSGDMPSPNHFSEFLTQVLKPMTSGRVEPGDVSVEWHPAVQRLRKASGVPEEDFGRFLRSLRLDIGAGTGVPERQSRRRFDIIDLSNALDRAVSEASGVVELDRRRVLGLVGWEYRRGLRSRHEFPVNLDTYAPLEGAIRRFESLVKTFHNGYVAVLGPPGSGKSTLLSQVLTGRSERIIRYYAYVPGSPLARTRLTGRGFLHDMVVMLTRAGFESRERQLPGRDADELREQFADQLDTAGEAFRRANLRTIIVVDGLDQVQHDRATVDDLLAELPRPDTLPSGVLVIVGSRTTAPLNPQAQQQLEERDAVVDLRNYRLSRPSIIEICSRERVVAHLDRTVHERIAELSGGYPLALGYLLNRLQEADNESAEDLLSDVLRYTGDIAGMYREVWNSLEDHAEIAEMLSVCSRLRIGFRTEWLHTWLPASAVRIFQTRLQYLFVCSLGVWRFFHESFRQFATDRTALGDGTLSKERADGLAHRQVAALCAQRGDPRIADEELYHRYSAGQRDEVLDLAQQATFREQHQRLRSPALIHEDLSLALDIAAGRGDVLVMLRLFLSLAELTARSAALEDVDMPAALYEAGLIDEAVAYCGADARHFPLAQVYGLAARLGADNHPAGREVFDKVEHHGFIDPERGHISGHEDDAAVAWTQAAVQFRPLPRVLVAIRRVLDDRASSDADDWYEQAERLGRYHRMMQVLIDAVSAQADRTALGTINSALGEHAASLTEESSSGTDDRAKATAIATVIDLRVRSRAELLRLATTDEDTSRGLRQLCATCEGVSVFHSTRLDIAETVARYGMADVAADLLDDSPFSEPLTVDVLEYDRESNTLDYRFRYWRLHHILARVADDSASPPPKTEIAQGGGIGSGIPAHLEADAVKLVSRVDSVLRDLGCIDAATESGHRIPPESAWTGLVSQLDVFRPAWQRGRPIFYRLPQMESELMRIIVEVAARYGDSFPQRLSDLLAKRFEEDPERWPPWLRSDLGNLLRSASARVPWYQQSLTAKEASAAAQDVHSRLVDLVDVVHRYARDGQCEAARRLALNLVPMAFGVGYRKDYQFDSWVAWLGRALAEPAGERYLGDATWLARVLIAADPMSENASRSAAIQLPAAVARAAPIASVRVFEYLVRHGIVNHLNALATLLEALTAHSGLNDMAAIRLAADITSELIVPAANTAYPELAERLVGAAQVAAGRAEATMLAEAMASRSYSHALATARSGWRKGLGLSQNQDQEDSGSADPTLDGSELVMSEDHRIPSDQVGSLIQTVDDIASLRRNESDTSLFAWARVVDKQVLTSDAIGVLLGVFDDGSRTSAEVRASLAEAAQRNGDHETALRLASDIIQNAPGDGWLGHWAARRRASATATRLGAQDIRIAACRDLARRAITNRWSAGWLVWELDSIVKALDPDLAATTTWPIVKFYLEGIAATLDLSEAEVLADHGCRWWLLSPTRDRRTACDGSTAEAAIAELAVGHLSHPTWLVRDAATATVTRALIATNNEVANALAGFAQPDASDDTLERAGRCLAAARDHHGYVTPPVLQPLEDTLANHPNQVIRDLAGRPPKARRRPPPSVNHPGLPPTAVPIGSEPLYLAPHEEQYQILARETGLNIDAVRADAARHASEALANLPPEQEVREALQASRLQFEYPHQNIAASRAAFGRVLADLTDAHLLDDAAPDVHRQLRTVDIDILTRTPTRRPNVVPTPPRAGHQRTDRWLTDINSRLEEHVTASLRQDQILIGGRYWLTVLDRSNLEEELVCGTTTGTSPPATGRILARRDSMTLKDLLDTSTSRAACVGEPLVVEHLGYTFHQIRGKWLAFRPDLATGLSWAPDATRPGRWHTPAGDLAVENIWWVDGWPGRAGPVLDDTEAHGHIVALTTAGLADLAAAFGKITRHFKVTRHGRDHATNIRSVSAARSIPLHSGP
ncbi:MAG: hypothetical protein OXF41_11770 [bacterium]|nr:hypothetical protein [bacterium]